MAFLLTFDIQSCDWGHFRPGGPGAKLFSGDLNLVVDCIKRLVLGDHCRFD
jgi:hypothetical protein